MPPRTKAERRERKRNAEKRRIRKHGKSLARVYKDAVLKRTPTKAAFKRALEDFNSYGNYMNEVDPNWNKHD